MQRQYTRINREWHEKNKMPKNASAPERTKWHLDHEKNCACRPMPENLRKEIGGKNENRQNSPR